LHDSWNFARRNELGSASKQQELEQDKLRLGSYSRIWQENSAVQLHTPPSFTPSLHRLSSENISSGRRVLCLNGIISRNSNKNWESLLRQKEEFLRGLNP
jgi:hypothetical protein